jgi:hypothetical protein
MFDMLNFKWPILVSHWELLLLSRVQSPRAHVRILLSVDEVVRVVLGSEAKGRIHLWLPRASLEVRIRFIVDGPFLVNWDLESSLRVFGAVTGSVELQFHV